jgi:hypothetical protein
VKGKNFGVSLEHDFRPDRCPQRQAAPIERMIRDIKLDQRKKDSYQFSEGSDIYIAVTWRPDSKRIKDSVCD